MTKKIGYGSTPEYTRWKKGQSGNPKGRPKGRPNFAADLAAELAQKIQITEGGKVKTITKQQALLKSLITGGIKGNVRAAQLMMAWAAASGDDPAAGSAMPPLEADDLKILKSYLERHTLPREDQS